VGGELLRTSNWAALKAREHKKDAAVSVDAVALSKNFRETSLELKAKKLQEKLLHFCQLHAGPDQLK